ncbi:MAG: hypothetical protein E7267_02990 [Lachnospiraceae bacterium]|nr:hypothetical protein [Lachnospiraceae bacterium]
MKTKITSVLLICSLMCLSIFSTHNVTYANDNSTITYFEDGSYLVTIIESCDDYTLNSRELTITENKTKTSNYYDSNNELLWYVKVKGNFTYNGTTATCNSSEVVAASNNSNWKISNRSASKSGSTAYASCTAKRYSGSTVVQTINRQVSLHCSPSGVYS